MRRIATLVLALFGLPLLSARSVWALQAASLDTWNFVSGPVCTDAAGHESICAQTEDVHVTGGSECVWSGETRPCTWFGFQFDYEGGGPGVTFECAYERSVPSDEGNPRGIRQRSAQTGTFTFELPERVGHFYNPMYELYDPAAATANTVIVTYLACSVEDVFLFDMTFNLRFR